MPRETEADRIARERYRQTMEQASRQRADESRRAEAQTETEIREISIEIS